jgi:cytochrome c553
MTNAQKWIIAVLFVFILLLVLSEITQKQSAEKETDLAIPQNQKNTPINLLEKANCFNCHGKTLSGTKIAPSIKGINTKWNKSELINYLKNPKKLERNSEYKSKMPAVTNLSEDEFEILTEYLLNNN